MFVGIVYVNFKRHKMNSDGSIFLTPDQRNWIAVVQKLEYQNPKQRAAPPYNKPQKMQVYELCVDPNFERTIFILIALNVITLSLTWYGANDAYNTVIGALNSFFSICFILEAILKLYAFGKKQYFAM